MPQKDEHDPTAIIIEAGEPIPNGGRLDDTEHPPAPPVDEPADAGCTCDGEAGA